MELGVPVLGLDPGRERGEERRRRRGVGGDEEGVGGGPAEHLAERRRDRLEAGRVVLDEHGPLRVEVEVGRPEPAEPAGGAPRATFGVAEGRAPLRPATGERGRRGGRAARFRPRGRPSGYSQEAALRRAGST